MTRLVSSVCIAVAVCLSASASAQNPIASSARQLREAGETEAALGLLENALRRDGPSPAVLAELGLTEIALGRFAAAVPHLKAALDSPGDPHVAEYSGELNRALGRAEQAASPPPASPAGSGASSGAPAPTGEPDPFAADVDPNADAMPMPAGATSAPGPSGTSSTPLPGGEAIPGPLRQTLTSDEPPAPPLVRTDWYRRYRGLPLLGVFADFTFDFGAHARRFDGEVNFASDAFLHDPPRLGGRLGVEGNLPLVRGLFATLRLFIGFAKAQGTPDMRSAASDHFGGTYGNVLAEFEWARSRTSPPPTVLATGRDSGGGRPSARRSSPVSTCRGCSWGWVADSAFSRSPAG